MTEQRILRHEDVDGRIPLLARLLPCIYNVWYRHACLAVLHTRSAQSVEEAWLRYGVPWPNVQVMTQIVKEVFCWPRDCYFLPEDDCWVLFCFWRRQLTDSLELVEWLVRTEDELGVTVPEQLCEVFAHLSFGDLLMALSEYGSSGTS